MSVPARDGVVDNWTVQVAVHDHFAAGRRSNPATLGNHVQVVEVRVIARLAVQAEGGHVRGCGVRASDSLPAAVNRRADAVLAVVTVAVWQTAAHLDGALYDGHKTVGVSGGAVGVACSVVDRGGPHVIRYPVRLARGGDGRLVDVREAASVCVLQDAAATLPVDDGDGAVVSVEARDCVVDNGALQGTIDDDIAGRARALDADFLEVCVVARLAMQTESGCHGGSSVYTGDSFPAAIN